MRTNEAIRQTLQDLISSVNTIIVEKESEFEGKTVMAYLVVPAGLLDRTEEVAKSVFTKDVLQDNAEAVTEEATEPEAPKKVAPKKKAPVKKAAPKKASGKVKK